MKASLPEPEGYCGVFLPRVESTTRARTLLRTQMDFRYVYRAFRACSRETFADIRRPIRLRLAVEWRKWQQVSLKGADLPLRFSN